MDRWRSAVLCCAIAAAALGLVAAAVAEVYDRNGLRFVAMVTADPTPSVGADVSVATLFGSFRDISIRSVRDVSLQIPPGLEGQKVGHISLSVSRGAADRAGLGTFDLVMPRHRGAGDVVLLRRGHLRVVLSTRRRTSSGKRILVRITGIPAKADSVGFDFNRSGRGILVSTSACPASPTLEVYAVRSGARPASATSGGHCR